MLLSPHRIKSTEFTSRIVCAPHWTGYNQGAEYSERYRDYLSERAAGGAAWILTEPMATHPTARVEFPPGQAPWETDMRANWSHLAERVHAHGARLSMTIGHAGRNTTWLETGLPVVGASSAPSPTIREDTVPLSESMLGELEVNYASIAAQAIDAGFDGVELQSTADYLLGSFLSPVDNRDDGLFSGSLEQRMKPLTRVLTAVRAALASGPLVGIRFSAEHGVAGGLEPDAAVKMVELLAQRGIVDYVSVIVGSYHNLHLITPTMGSDPQPAVASASAIRTASGVPVVVAGRIPTPADASRILEEGGADLIAFARPFIADPAWPRKLAEGRASEVRPCLYCNQQCVRRLSERRPISCVQNPGAGREAYLGPAVPSIRRPTALVVGAGPAGLEAAVQLAAGGAAVRLLDRATAPGGRLALAASIPGREEWKGVIEPRLAELRRHGVEPELGMSFDPSGPSAGEADIVVLATGGAPWRAPCYRAGVVADVPGLSAQHVLTLDDIVSEPPEGEHLLVVDETGSRSLIAVLQWLRGRGCTYEIVTTFPQLAWPTLVLTQEWSYAVPPVLQGMVAHGLSRLNRVEGDVAEVVSLPTGETRSIPLRGRILWSLGDRPADDAPLGGLALADNEVALIGDARSARGTGAALSDARRVALAVLAGDPVPTVFRPTRSVAH